VIPLPKNPGADALRNGLKLQQAGKLEDAVRAYDDVLKVLPKSPSENIMKDCRAF
jgi:hypothetical protein